LIRFFMNGYLWRIRYAEPNDPELIDRTGKYRLATTNPITRTVTLSSVIPNDILPRVIIHELGHCALVSFGLLKEIHRMTKPSHWIEAEEWICNFIADYGLLIFQTAYETFGNDAWLCIPNEFEKLIA